MASAIGLSWSYKWGRFDDFALCLEFVEDLLAHRQTPGVWEVGGYPSVNLTLQLEIKLVQQLILGREVGEERAGSNSGVPGDLCCRRAESDLGNLVHRPG
jgi:hypothetical protein